MKPRYSFEKVAAGDCYQVRLQGEYVTHVVYKNSKLVDEYLKENGYDSREDFLEKAWSKYGITNEEETK